ncbi:hypothetical protein H8356DRAFT_1357561 [Neocallimastix lanati (nom. inval.)]|nr:hypothetical protein H8356DRAFT_1357561 [Neocallimastix sp. JGI-2020a]
MKKKFFYPFEIEHPIILYTIKASSFHEKSEVNVQNFSMVVLIIVLGTFFMSNGE